MTSKDLYRAAWAASLGSALEYYDFALYNLASALILGPLFFPTAAPDIQLIASFGTYFLGFAIRPVGGIVFGILGDRVGRRPVLIYTILLMGASSTLIGVLPTYDQAGYWAPFLLIGCRLLQGLGAGAEQAGAAVLMAECAPRDKRGYYASLPFMGVLMGIVAAALVYLLMVRRIADVTHSWFWRVPFLLSLFIVAVAIFIRRKLKETPIFTRLEASHHIDRHPLSGLLRDSRKTLLLVVGLRMAENGGSSIYQSLAISYMVGVTALSGQTGTWALLLAGATGVAVVPLAGKLGDRCGRVRVYRWFAIYQLLLAFPAWWVLSRGNATAGMLTVSIALVASWGMFATQGALLPELFGARHRYVGVATARELSAVIAGGAAPLVGASLIAWTTRHSGGTKTAAISSWIPIAAYLSILSCIGVATTFFTPETRGRDLDDLNDAGQSRLL
jgi:MFS transporter, MHS family, metabolite:H+ symporter